MPDLQQDDQQAQAPWEKYGTPWTKYGATAPAQKTPPTYSTGATPRTGDIQMSPGAPIANVRDDAQTLSHGATLPVLPKEQPTDYIKRGITAGLSVPPDQQAANIKTETAKNVHDLPRNLGNTLTAASLPMLAGALLTAPVATVAGVGGSALGSYGGKKIAEAAGGGDNAQDWASLGGGIAGGLGGSYAGLKLQGAIPSTARASENFNQVKSVVGENQVPVTDNLSKSTMRIKELSDTGSAMPQVVRKFMVRVTDPDKPPLTFNEARDFYSNVSRLSADENMRLTPVMKRAIGQFAQDLGGTISNTADAGGKGEQFDNAMTEYRRAMTMKDKARTVGSIAAKGALGAGTVYAIKSLFGL